MRRVSDILDFVLDGDELQSESDSPLNIPSMSFTSNDCSASILLLNYILIAKLF
jgi:hypothetical protein